MSNHQKRLDKIEGSLSPLELVLFLVQKARDSGSLQECFIWYDENFARVVVKMETAVSERLRNEPPAVVAKAIRGVRTEIAFLIQLWVACNECNRQLFERSLQSVALLYANVRQVDYLSRLYRAPASAAPSDGAPLDSDDSDDSDELIDIAETVRKEGAELLEELLATKSAIAAISHRYFADRPLIFGGRDEKINAVLEAVECFCQRFNQLLNTRHLLRKSDPGRGLSMIDIAQVRRAAKARSERTVDDLLAWAKREAYFDLADPIEWLKYKMDVRLGKRPI
jgi:hypothetical protein